MTVVSFLAVANATLAVVSALLGAAPFTPAAFFFVAYAPLAALFAHTGQTVAALVVVGAAALAWMFSPLELGQDRVASLVWLTWVGCWSMLVVYFSRHKLLAAYAAAPGGGLHGASQETPRK